MSRKKMKVSTRGMAVPRTAANTGNHWLDDPKNVRRLIWLGVLMLLVLAALEFVVDHHAHFDPKSGVNIDAKPEFFALYGFFACVVQVLVAKAIGSFLKRKDTFYAADEKPMESAPDHHHSH